MQIANLKLEDRAVSASAIKLLSEEGHEALNDEQTIEEAKIENDNVIYFVFKKDGMCEVTFEGHFRNVGGEGYNFVPRTCSIY